MSIYLIKFIITYSFLYCIIQLILLRLLINQLTCNNQNIEKTVLMCAYREKNHLQQYRTSLRSSSQFLNLLVLRSSLANTMNTTRIKTLNDTIQSKRFSNLHVVKPSSHQKSINQQANYMRLKDTLQTLQCKINKAQKILASPKNFLKNMHCIDFDVQVTISDMDQKITKKNQQSSKFLKDEKISDISKNSSIKTCKINKNINETQQIVKYSKQYYINSLLTMGNSKPDPRVKQHIKLSFDVIKKLYNCQALQHKEMSVYRVNFPVSKVDKKTLLLDIDDTILNCDDERNEKIKYDFQLDIEDQDGSYLAVYIKLRPYALTFLKNMSKIYEIIAYTGSIEKYAKKVLQQIDPDNEIFSYKLYRDSCFQICNGIYVKDTRIINRRPENVVLVDNSPYSYIYQLENGIPILPYQKGPDDQLPKLQKYLIALSKCNDVRQMNKNVFKFHRYQQFNGVTDMIRTLYQNQK